MSTLSEIEAAAEALSVEEQKILMLHLSRKLACSVPAASHWLVPPPAVPKEELRRIHALIESEFSRVDAEGW